MDEVTVTQADKLEAEAFWQEYGPFRMGTVSALAEAFARHRLAALADAQDVKALVEALKRQCDNMAFVLNHFDVPHRWYEKLQDELLKDRAALAKHGGA